MGTLNIEDASEKNSEDSENNPPDLETRLINVLTLICPALLVFLLWLFFEKDSRFAARLGAATADFFGYLIFLGFCELANVLFHRISGNNRKKTSRWRVSYLVFTAIYIFLFFIITNSNSR